MSIQLNNIVFEYKSSATKRVFDNLTTEFFPQKVNCLVGANAVGKTTLLALIAGQENYNYFGDIIADGKLLNGLSARERASIIMKMDQDVSRLLVPHMTIGEHLVLSYLSNQGGSIFRSAEHRKTRESIMTKLNEVDLISDDWNELWHSRIYQLNGGMQQNVALAMLAIRSPRIALLDEPTANLDAEKGEQCFKFIENIAHKSNCIFVIVSHDLSLVAKYADVIYVLRNKRITNELQRSSQGFNSQLIAQEMGLFDG